MKHLHSYKILRIAATLAAFAVAIGWPGMLSGQTFGGTGNKPVIGNQTTALGVTYYGNAAPNVTPSASNWRTVVRFHVDTSAQVQWAFLGSTWKAQGVIRRVTPPPATATNGSATLDYRYAQWQADGDSTRYTYDFQEGCWSPLGVYRLDTIPTNVAAGVGTGAVCYEFSPWLNTDNDSLYLYQDGTWLSVGTGSGGGSGSTEQADGITILGDGSGGDPFRVDTTLLVTVSHLADTAAAIRADFPSGGGSGVDNFYRDGDTLRLAVGVDTFSVSAVEPDSSVYATLTTLADSMAIVRDSIDALRADIGTGGGVGTVTSVGLDLPTSVFDISGSPVTSSGTLTATLDTQAANAAFLGPVSGAAAAPTFRVPGATDLNAWGALSGSGTTGRVPYYSATNVLTNSADLFFGSTRKLGVGTSSPSAFTSFAGTAIHIYDNVTGTPSLRIESPGLIGGFAADNNTLLFGSSKAIVFGSNFSTTNTSSIDFISYKSSGALVAMKIAHTAKIGIYSGSTIAAAGTAIYSLDFGATGSLATDGIRVPAHATAGRPTGAAGVFAFNTGPWYEGHNGTAWRRFLDLPDSNPTTNDIPYWTGSAWGLIAKSTFYTDSIAAGAAGRIAFYNSTRSLTNSANLTYQNDILSFISALTDGTEVFKITSAGIPRFAITGNGNIKMNEISTFSNSSTINVYAANTATAWRWGTRNVVDISSGSYSLIGHSNANLTIQSTGSIAVENINPNLTFHASSTSSGIIRGKYYNPTVTTQSGAAGRHVAWENVVGDMLFNSSSGNTAVGATTDTTLARKFTVVGDVRITDLTTDAHTHMVVADADGDLSSVRTINSVVSTTTDASGDVAVTFGTAMPDATYTALVTSENLVGNASHAVHSKTTSGFSIRTYHGGIAVGAGTSVTYSWSVTDY